MTTYRTGNAIGSADPRDLYDNAENLDELVNSDSKQSHPDRLGVPRKTWHGMEEEFDGDQALRESEHDADQTRRESEFVDAQADKQQRFNLLLANSGYEYLADYAAGIEITEYNQVMRGNAGELWRAAATTELPYTTTGTGLPEGGAFIAIGDADIRNDLAAGIGAGKGGLLVRGAVIYVNTIADLQALDTSELVDGQQASVGEAGMFTWSGSEWLPKNSETITVRVPSDYPTLQEAIDTLSNFKTAQGAFIDLLIESGHSPALGIKIKSGDYSYINIKSEDPSVTLSQEFPSDGIFLDCEDALCPSFGILLDMDSLGYRGIQVRNSSINILGGCGVLNCFGSGEISAGIIASSGSSVSAAESVFNGNGRNIWLTTASRGDFAGADLKDAYNIGAYVSRGSVLNASDTDFSGANQGTNSTGLYVLRSFVSAPNGANFSDCRIGCLAAAGSIVSVPASSALNCTFRGYLSDSSVLNVTGSDATGSSTGFDVLNGGEIKRHSSTGSSGLVENVLVGTGVIFSDSSPSAWIVSEEGLPVSTDSFDDIVWTGFYRNSSSSTVGAPTSQTFWNVIHITTSSSTATQIASRTGSPSLRYRNKSGGNWGDWRVVWDSSNTQVDQNGFIKTL